MKKTSVDWLIEKISTIDSVYLGEDGVIDHLLQTVRKMHREEVEEAYEAGFYDDMEDGKDFDTKYYTRNFETP